MRIRMIFAAAAIIALLWWASDGLSSQVNGAHTGTSQVSVPLPVEIPGTNTPPDPVPVVPPPAPVPDVSVGDDAENATDGAAKAGTDAMDQVKSWMESARSWLMSNGLWIMLTIVGAAVLIAIAKRKIDGDDSDKDPQRMYAQDQRTEAFARAGGQCEYMEWGLTRCRKPAEHADHLIPHSKGGATSILNCVASCAHHNTSKGAKILPKWQVRWLMHRRRRYFPAGIPVAVGEMYSPDFIRDPSLHPAPEIDDAPFIDEDIYSAPLVSLDDDFDPFDDLGEMAEPSQPSRPVAREVHEAFGV